MTRYFEKHVVIKNQTILKSVAISLLVFCLSTMLNPSRAIAAPDSNPHDLSEFNHLDPQHLVPDKPLELAMEYFKKNRVEFSNQKFVGVIDYTKSSLTKRFYIINLQSGNVESMAVAHGKGSDPRRTSWAKHFSNSTHQTHASSIGFYRTAGIYYGKHGQSMRIEGLSPTNSNAFKRAVVVHGAPYVSENAAWGRSWGCPAVAPTEIKHVITELKGGAMIYAYGGQSTHNKAATALR